MSSLSSERIAKLPSLVLPSHFRQDLALPQGVLLVHPERGVIRGLSFDVAVGDVVSTRHSAKLKIVDYKTMRRDVDEKALCQEQHLFALNPPGCLSLNSITMALSASRGVFCVIGEEDLLVLPFLSREGEKTAYGQPGVGIVVARSSVEIALKVLKILKPAVVKYSYSKKK